MLFLVSGWETGDPSTEQPGRMSTKLKLHPCFKLAGLESLSQLAQH